MSIPPLHPSLYHITHVDNLPAILAQGGLLSDRQLLRHGGPAQSIGMSAIKRRRIDELYVPCHPGTTVGDYVPFYFCPRSVMLYVIHMANHPDLIYRGGQSAIVHLEADLRTVVRWANEGGRRWAFSLSNAGARYTEFRSALEDLEQIDWNAIAAGDFRAPEIKERKQAEFLLHDTFPLGLVARIGVSTQRLREQVLAVLKPLPGPPMVEVRPDWYF